MNLGHTHTTRKHTTPPSHPGNLGQLFIIGFDGTEMSPSLASLLSRIQPGGIILFARNIVDAQQTYKLLQDCQACVPIRLFTCVDVEGGRVDRFRNVLGPVPSAAEVFHSGDRGLFHEHGSRIGQACRSLGFNTDFAPVVDLAFENSHTVMGSRAVSPDPRRAVVYAREFLAGLRAAGTIGAAKHFPGLGEAHLDTHQELPSVEKSWKKLWNEDIYPYRALRREAPMVVVGHANYSRVTRDRTPASLSRKWITSILREKIGYHGLIVSDDLEMGGVLKAAPIDQASVQFIRAGGDLCLICHIEEYIRRSYETMAAEVECDTKFSRRVSESVSRILAFKKRSAEIRRSSVQPTQARLEKLTRQLWEFGERVRLASLARHPEERS